MHCAVCSPCIVQVVELSGLNVAELSDLLLLGLRPEQLGYCFIGLLSSVSRETHNFCFLYRIRGLEIP